ncbi:MAG: hypothetical protein M3Q39_00465 [Actinomycetota bacterium]|nr:hypothetical protein [Actinomycetota bacterium]
MLTRLDWACSHHLAIDEFADELRAQVGRLRNLAGAVTPKPELCEGVACGRCDTRALWRAQGRVSCLDCGKIYDDNEYLDLVRDLAKREKSAA